MMSELAWCGGSRGVGLHVQKQAVVLFMISTALRALVMISVPSDMQSSIVLNTLSRKPSSRDMTLADVHVR